MKKKSYLIILAALLTFLVTGCKAKETSFNGYLIDKHCSEKKDASEETKMCLNMDMCKESGYGVSVKQADGKYKFYKFDDKGQQLAEDILSKTTKEKGVSVVVKGTEDNDVLKVSAITEN